MQEVVKRMQDRQNAVDPPKKIRQVNLCMVSVSDNKLYPVMIPKNVYLNTGDLAVFIVNGVTKQGTVLFFDAYREEDDPMWTLMTVTTGMAPIKAIEFFRKYKCEWEEKN